MAASPRCAESPAARDRFAVLSAAAVMVLQNVIRADGLTREKSQQIAALQRASGFGQPLRLKASPQSSLCN
jgi:hypothetical protein